ncbi:exosome complex protein LRP1, partial [Lecanoromycetidae sp. Uapishka_2]
MEATDLVPLIEVLDDNIDDLEEALAPLLKGAISDTAGKLPLLDKAQLLNGINAKAHPVFRELTRVKQYFEKIKTAESAGKKPSTKIDKEAAARFIKHALAGNEKHDMNEPKQQQKEKGAIHTRFEEIAKDENVQKDTDTVSLGNPSSNEPNREIGDTAAAAQPQEPAQESPHADSTTVFKVKKGRKRKRKSDGVEPVSSTNTTEGETKAERKRAKQARKMQEKALKESHEPQTSSTNATEGETKAERKRARKARKMHEKALKESQDPQTED